MTKEEATALALAALARAGIDHGQLMEVIFLSAEERQRAYRVAGIRVDKEVPDIWSVHFSPSPSDPPATDSMLIIHVDPRGKTYLFDLGGQREI
ncbi:MAG: hypothetical protein HS116_13175 [Planctomycetes bacterium]|nr:hypothetical protein [Planctomycetota bacterium]